MSPLAIYFHIKPRTNAIVPPSFLVMSILLISTTKDDGHILTVYGKCVSSKSIIFRLGKGVDYCSTYRIRAIWDFLPGSLNWSLVFSHSLVVLVLWMDALFMKGCFRLYSFISRALPYTWSTYGFLIHSSRLYYILHRYIIPRSVFKRFLVFPN